MKIKEHLSVYLESGYLFDDMSEKLKRLSRNTRRSEQACLIGMFGEYLEV